MNPWHELGLEESASAEEIRRAYRRLAAEHHPDRNPDDDQAAERFQRVRQAYEMLTKPPPQRQASPWPEASPQGAGGPWATPGQDPFGGRVPPGVQVRFVAPPQLKALMERLRKVFLLVFVGGLAGVVALGHAVRGLPWAELAWPHQLLLSFGMGLGVSAASFFAWLLAIFGLGFRWGTLVFWALIAFQVAR